MDEIEQRLRESTDACIKSFENWVKKSKDLESRESLMETLHEVRKVLARVEIEIAISERDRLGSRPLPIPPHRSSRKEQGGGDDDIGNFQGGDDDGDNSGNGDQPQQPRRQQSGPRRRPMHQRGGGGNGNSENQQS